MRDSEFVIADDRIAYLDGNSLGRLPVEAALRVRKVVEHGWGQQLIAGWNEGWIDLPMRLGNKLSSVIGCHPEEVLVADSTSVNLFKLATAALRVQQGRKHVITDATNFPSDIYILESAQRACGGEPALKIVGNPDQVLLDSKEIIDQIDEQTALVSLSHVTFKSGQLHDIGAITAAAHEKGALVLWDLSHSVGAVPINLSAHNVDLAVGCTYKYLCGGPGAPAFLYCRKNLQDSMLNPIAGWFSHAKPFSFETEYAPSDGIQRFATGTPPIISMAAIEAGIDLVVDAGIQELRNRSIELSTTLIECFEKQLAPLGFELRSPRAAEQRGSHVSLGHPEARRITEALIQKHRVIPDFRAPDNLRLGIAPLYTRESEIAQAIAAMAQIVQQKEYLEVSIPSSPVT